MYLPTAFLTDLGVVALVLYLITQSGKDVKLPWPKFGVDLDEVKPPTKNFWVSRIATAIGAVIMLAITDFALYVFARHRTIFFANVDWANLRPLFTPGPGRRISIVVIAMLALTTMTLLVKLFTRSRWVDVASNAVSLGLIGLLLRESFDGLFALPVSERALRAVKYSLKFILLFIALMTTIELVKSIVVVSRRKLNSATRNFIH
jgi:ABC-type enterochelin transport system permease subunit